MFPLADIRGTFVEGEKARHPLSYFRADGEELAVEVSAELWLP